MLKCRCLNTPTWSAYTNTYLMKNSVILLLLYRFASMIRDEERGVFVVYWPGPGTFNVVGSCVGADTSELRVSTTVLEQLVLNKKKRQLRCEIIVSKTNICKPRVITATCCTELRRVILWARGKCDTYHRYVVVPCTVNCTVRIWHFFKDKQG